MRPTLVLIPVAALAASQFVFPPAEAKSDCEPSPSNGRGQLVDLPSLWSELYRTRRIDVSTDTRSITATLLERRGEIWYRLNRSYQAAAEVGLHYFEAEFEGGWGFVAGHSELLMAALYTCDEVWALESSRGKTPAGARCLTTHLADVSLSFRNDWETSRMGLAAPLSEITLDPTCTVEAKCAFTMYGLLEPDLWPCQSDFSLNDFLDALEAAILFSAGVRALNKALSTSGTIATLEPAFFGCADDMTYPDEYTSAALLDEFTAAYDEFDGIDHGHLLAVNNFADGVVGRAACPGNHGTSTTAVGPALFPLVFSHEVGHNFNGAHEDPSCGSTTGEADTYCAVDRCDDPPTSLMWSGVNNAILRFTDGIENDRGSDFNNVERINEAMLEKMGVRP